MEEFNKQMQSKLSLTEFERWFPTKQFDDPQQYFKTLISVQVSVLEKQIKDMVQLWDSKLAKMGRELNIGSVLKRINEKADVSTVNRGIEEANSRVDQVEQTFLKIIDEMEEINRSNQINTQHINEIASYQREVSIGKRNVNCLSCSPEKTNDQ